MANTESDAKLISFINSTKILHDIFFNFSKEFLSKLEDLKQLSESIESDLKNNSNQSIESEINKSKILLENLMNSFDLPELNSEPESSALELNQTSEQMEEMFVFHENKIIDVVLEANVEEPQVAGDVQVENKDNELIEEVNEEKSDQVPVDIEPQQSEDNQEEVLTLEEMNTQSENVVTENEQSEKIDEVIEIDVDSEKCPESSEILVNEEKQEQNEPSKEVKETNEVEVVSENPDEIVAEDVSVSIEAQTSEETPEPAQTLKEAIIAEPIEKIEESNENNTSIEEALIEDISADKFQVLPENLPSEESQEINENKPFSFEEAIDEELIANEHTHIEEIQYDSQVLVEEDSKLQIDEAATSSEETNDDVLVQIEPQTSEYTQDISEYVEPSENITEAVEANINSEEPKETESELSDHPIKDCNIAVENLIVNEELIELPVTQPETETEVEEVFTIRLRSGLKEVPYQSHKRKNTKALSEDDNKLAKKPRLSTRMTKKRCNSRRSKRLHKKNLKKRSNAHQRLRMRLRPRV